MQIVNVFNFFELLLLSVQKFNWNLEIQTEIKKSELAERTCDC